LALSPAIESGVAQTADVVSPAEIVLGMSTVLTGGAQVLGKNMQQGILAGLERANREGGIGGRKLRLISLDDGYEPSRTAPNMRRLIEDDHVLTMSKSLKKANQPPGSY
jgi:branched-chain amino acid transport system substrate-binding protein